MDTDDLERVNEWNQPKILRQMRDRNGGTLSPQPKQLITSQPTILGRTREDFGQQESGSISVDNLPLSEEEELR